MITLEKWFTYYGGDKGKTYLRGYAQTTGIIIILIFLYKFLSKLRGIKRDEHRDINTQVHSLIIYLSIYSVHTVAVFLKQCCFSYFNESMVLDRN